MSARNLLVCLVAGAVVLFCPGWAAAQEAGGGTQSRDAIGGEAEIDLSEINQILMGGAEDAPGTVSAYDPAGRRDPFKSLLEGMGDSDEVATGVRPPGLPGMLIDELKVGGIIQTESGILAFVQGRDNLSYIIFPGTKLYDGEVREIQPKRVVFRRQVNDPKQLRPYEDIVREIAD